MAAARRAETVPSEVPYQCGNRVLSFFQEGRDVYFIVIGVSGSGTPLQGAFENDRFAVDPEPVFAVRCDAGDGLSGNILHVGGEMCIRDRRQGFNLGDSIITLQIGIHGVPVDMPDGVYRDLGSAALSGYWRYSMNDRDEHYYKRVYTGCARAVDFLCSLPEFDGKTIDVYKRQDRLCRCFIGPALCRCRRSAVGRVGREEVDLPQVQVG